MALIKKSVFGPGLYFFFTLFSRGSIRMGALVFGCGVLITWGSNRKNTVWTILRGFFHKVFYSTTFFPQNSNFRQISATFEGKWLNFDKNSISFDQNSRIFFRNSSFFSLKINLTPCILAKTFHKGRLCTSTMHADRCFCLKVCVHYTNFRTNSGVLPRISTGCYYVVPSVVNNRT